MKKLKTWWICRKFGIKNYTLNIDGSIDVQGDVNLNRTTLTNLRSLDGIRFRKSIKELDKLPITFNIVYGDFRCQNNNLSSFDRFPKEIHGDLIISKNKFKSLSGCPKIIKRPFVNNRMICDGNNILTLCGYREGTNISIKSNPINNIWNLFRDYNLIDLFNDYDVVRDNGEISFYRLFRFLEDNGFDVIGRHQLRILKGYKLIEDKEDLSNAYKQLLKLK
jgi:hypothetical protein